MIDPAEMKRQTGPPKSPEDFNAGVIFSPDTHREQRVPPGQVRTAKWPVLQAGRVPEISPEEWTLTIGGLVESTLQITWNEFRELPRVQVFSDFHCVTRWSRLGNLWEGVSTREIADRVGIQAEAAYVIANGYDDGWTTNFPLADFLAEDALLADLHDGEPLSSHHGGPVRLIVPRLYAWKSAKWLKAIEFVAEDRPGYWESVGYHNHGDPWTEERFS